MHLLQNVVLAEWGPLLIVLGLTPRMAAGARADPRRADAHAPARRAADLARRPTTPGTSRGPTTPRSATSGRSSTSSTPRTSSRAACSGGRSSRAAGRAAPRRCTCSARSCSAARSACCSPCSPTPSTASTSTCPASGASRALVDQQIAGVTMASEQSVVLFAAFAIYLLRFFDEEASADTYRAPTVKTEAALDHLDVGVLGVDRPQHHGVPLGTEDVEQADVLPAEPLVGADDPLGTVAVGAEGDGHVVLRRTGRCTSRPRRRRRRSRTPAAALTARPLASRHARLFSAE